MAQITLFAALNILDGRVVGRCMPRHTHQEFIKFLNTVERAIPAGKIIHAIADNYATHKRPKVLTWLTGHPRWIFHPNLSLLDQRRRELLLRYHPKAHPARRVHLRRRPPGCHHSLHPRA